jgi:hypothetical protein
MRLLGLSLVLVLVATLAGCGDKAMKPVSSPSAKSVSPARGHDKTAAAPADDLTFTKIEDAAVPGPADPIGGSGGPKGTPKSAAPEAKPATVAAMAGTDRPRARMKRPPQSGLLTAGSFDDNLNPDYFLKFAGKMGQLPGLADLPARFTGRRLVVLVKGADGAPVGNAPVRLGDHPGVELTTRTDGRAVFLSSFDGLADGELPLSVTPPGGGAAIRQAVPQGVTRWEITLPSTRTALPKNLDLALVIDTTGSMGDELEFIKTEIKGIVGSVRDKFPNVNQRYGLVLYRDDGDEYVVRTFPFTASIEDFKNNLSPQRAAGGGDEPEAMHRGLEEAVQLTWRDSDTARVLFVLTDAPPHAQFMGRTMNALNTLRKRGVAVYPVACSGTSDAAEFVLRACGLLTGSEYLFLTDDSGVGNPHAEPHIPFYHVQKLDRLMVRMIAAELSGRRITPEKDEIIRTVGKPIN